MTLFDVKSPVLHAVSGQVELEQILCELEYIGTGGMLVRSEHEFAKGTELRNILVTISGVGYPEVFVAEGRVVGNFLGLSAIMFLGEPAGLRDFLDERLGEA